VDSKHVYQDIANEVEMLLKNNNTSKGGSMTARAMPTTSTHSLATLLKTKLSEQYLQVRKAFRDMDVNKDGSIGAEELAHVFAKLNIQVDWGTVMKLMNQFDSDNNGKISYDEFMEHFAPGIQGKEEGGVGISLQQRHEALKTKQQSTRKMAIPTMSLESLESLLKTKLSEQYLQVRKAFRDMDVNKDGCVDAQELAFVMNKFNIPVEESQCIAIFKRLDSDNNGKMSYDEFMEHFAPGIQGKEEGGVGISLQHHHAMVVQRPSRAQTSSSLSRPSSNAMPKGPVKVRGRHNMARRASIAQEQLLDGITVDEVMSRLKNKLASQTASVHNAFRLFDKDNDGTISPLELRRVLDRYCLHLPDRHFATLMAKIDTDGDGLINYAEFMKAFGFSILPAETGGVSIELQKRADKMPPLSRKMTRRPSYPALGVKAKPMDMLKLHQKIKKIIAGSAQDIKRSFQALDPMCDGTVTCQEFVGVLASRGIAKVGSEEILSIASHYSASRKSSDAPSETIVHGRVNYTRFLAAFRVIPGSATGHKVVAAPRRVVSYAA